MPLTAARWVIDLDGVVWRGTTPIEGSVEAIEHLVAAGHEVLFCTNHAESPAIKERRLAQMGVTDPAVVTSAQAAAHLCGMDKRALVLGEPSLSEVVAQGGIEVTDAAELDPDGPVPEVDAVIVGASSNWDRSRTGLVADAVRSGAWFIATNDDPTYPFTGSLGPRLLPGAGALVAAVEITSGVRSTVAGKPNQPMADLVLERFGAVDYVVGDRFDTDGLFARRLGSCFALVLSGSTEPSEVTDGQVADFVHTDLRSVVAEVLDLSAS